MNGARSLTDKEIEDVFKELKTLRDKTLFLLGIKCGMRISELLSLKISDVMEFGKVGSQVTLAKKSTKGKIAGRTLPLTDSAKAIVKEYLDSIPGYVLDQPLFKSTQSDKAITREMAHKILKKAFNDLELPGNCRTHSLRKSYACRVHKQYGERIEYTRKAMGHVSLSSTCAYLPIDDEVVKKGILAAG